MLQTAVVQIIDSRDEFYEDAFIFESEDFISFDLLLDGCFSDWVAWRLVDLHPTSEFEFFDNTSHNPIGFCFVNRAHYSRYVF